MFDGSTLTFERLRRPNTVDVIATVGGKILIQDQEQPDTGLFVSLPSGRMDEGEEPLQAAQRELLEETGYTSSDWQLLREHQPASKIEWTIYTCIARNCAQTHEQYLDPGERITNHLISFEEFLMLSENPRFRGGDMVEFLLRLRLDSGKREEFQKFLFGNG